MTKSNVTKRALLVSALSIVMCLAMLIGTTFAWFTDTASTGLNKIQAGNLDVELFYKDGGTFKKVNTETKVFDETALWEPGYVEYAVLKVENAGTLALKYKLGINIASEKGSVNVNGKEFKLSQYIKFAVIEGDLTTTDGFNRADLVKSAEETGANNFTGYSKEVELLEKDGYNVVTLVVWMPETVGNDANYAAGNEAPEINFGINVVATQAVHEEDSFGNDYDKDATYPVVTVNGIAYSSFTSALTAAENGDTITLLADTTLTKMQTISGKNITIDLNGYSIKAKLTALKIADGTNLTVQDSSGASGMLYSDYTGIIVDSGTTLTVKSGTIKGDTTAVSNSGTVNIEGTASLQRNVTYSVNCKSGSITNMSGGWVFDIGTTEDTYDYTVNVSGGTVENYVYATSVTGGTITDLILIKGCEVSNATIIHSIKWLDDTIPTLKNVTLGENFYVRNEGYEVVKGADGTLTIQAKN